MQDNEFVKGSGMIRCSSDGRISSLSKAGS